MCDVDDDDHHDSHHPRRHSSHRIRRRVCDHESDVALLAASITSASCFFTNTAISDGVYMPDDPARVCVTNSCRRASRTLDSSNHQ